MRVEVYVNSKAPACPSNMIVVQALSSTSIRVTWSPLRDSKQCRLNGVLRGYKVAYKYLYGSKTKYQDVRSSGTTKTVVTGLEKYTEYCFQVLAYTVLDGPLSKAIMTRTKEDKPDGPPENVSTIKTNATSYRVTWQPVHQNVSNGPITKYEIRLTLVGIGKNVYNIHTMFHVSRTFSLHYFFYNLNLCAQYTVSVRAFTGKGPGPYSGPFAFSTL